MHATNDCHTSCRLYWTHWLHNSWIPAFIQFIPFGELQIFRFNADKTIYKKADSITKKLTVPEKKAAIRGTTRDSDRPMEIYPLIRSSYAGKDNGFSKHTSFWSQNSVLCTPTSSLCVGQLIRPIWCVIRFTFLLTFSTTPYRSSVPCECEHSNSTVHPTGILKEGVIRRNFTPALLYIYTFFSFSLISSHVVFEKLDIWFNIPTSLCRNSSRHMCGLL